MSPSGQARSAALTLVSVVLITLSLTAPGFASVSGPAFDVEVFPGDDVNAILGSHPEGTTFLLRAGVYRRVTLMPRSGQTIVGEPGTVLDGEGVIADGVGQAVANDVTVRGVSIRNYTDKCVDWGAKGWGRNWTIEDSELAYCGAGIQVKTGGRYLNNYIHHNQTHGMVGSGMDIVLAGNEIAFNRADGERVSGAGNGAVKLVSIEGVTVRDNYVHDNYDSGIHLDGHTTGALVEGNTVVDNEYSGIFYELGYAAVIRNNYVEGNGFASSGRGGGGAGILVSAAYDVEVYGNTVINNRHGILGKYDERCCQRSGADWELKNLLVRDNTVVMSEGWTGVYDSAEGQPSYQESWNNHFEGNAYTFTPADGRFMIWLDPDPSTATYEKLTLPEWQHHHPNDG